MRKFHIAYFRKRNEESTDPVPGSPDPTPDPTPDPNELCDECNKSQNECTCFVCPDCEEQVSYNDETCGNCGFSISSHKWKKTKIGDVYAHFYDWDGCDARFDLVNIIKVEKYKKIEGVSKLVETEYRPIDVCENGIYEPIRGYVLNVKNSVSSDVGVIPDKEYGWYTCSYYKKDGSYYCTINELKFKLSNGSIVPVE